MTPEQLADYRDRLHVATKRLLTLASKHPSHRRRLLGKCEGIQLALDYLRGYPEDDRDA